MPDTESFPLALQHGIPVFVCGEHTVLIDTGSPVSFGRESLSIAGVRHELPEAFGPLRIDDIAQYLGGGIDALIGTDLLAQYWVLLDLPRGVVVFSCRSVPCQGVEVIAPLVLGTPKAELRVAGQIVHAVLDTGARLSYMDPTLIQTAPIGREDDFHPLLGAFPTDVHELDVEVAGMQYTGRFGVLPSALREPLAEMDVKWIVGMQFLGRFPMLLDLANGRLTIRDRPG